jgi:hypothetical protein
MHVNTQQNFSGLIQQFRLSLDWLKTLGVRVHVGRLNAYARFCDRFERAPVRNAAILNFAEISRIVDIWKHRDSLRAMGDFEERIRRIGSSDILHRDDQGHAPRNHLFELFCACWLVDIGMALEPSIRGDITAELLGRRYLVECKRPSSELSLREQVRDASAKIRQRLRGRDMGAVLVDLTVLANRDLQHREAASDNEALHKTKSHVESIKHAIQELQSTELQGSADAFIAGYYWAPCWNTSRNDWCVVEQWLLLANPQISYSARYWFDIFENAVKKHASDKERSRDTSDPSRCSE